MDAGFVIIAALTVVSALAAMSLRNLVHCALCLTITFAGLAALYLKLNAQFVGLAQVLVYIGAVAILIVFAILLTRSDDQTPRADPFRGIFGWRRRQRRKGLHRPNAQLAVAKGRAG